MSFSRVLFTWASKSYSGAVYLVSRLPAMVCPAIPSISWLIGTLPGYRLPLCLRNRRMVGG